MKVIKGVFTKVFVENYTNFILTVIAFLLFSTVQAIHTLTWDWNTKTSVDEMYIAVYTVAEALEEIESELSDINDKIR